MNTVHFICNVIIKHAVKWEYQIEKNVKREK
jgi:hypothetical protein